MALRFRRRRRRLKNDWWNVDRFFVLTCSHAPAPPSPRNSNLLNVRVFGYTFESLTNTHFSRPWELRVVDLENPVSWLTAPAGFSKHLFDTTTPTFTQTHISGFFAGEREKLLLLCKVSQTHFLAAPPGRGNLHPHPPPEEVRSSGEGCSTICVDS